MTALVSVTVRDLVVLTTAFAVLGTLAAGWLAFLGFRAYRRQGTRLLALATAALALVTLSRVVGLGAWGLLVEHDLSVKALLTMQVVRSGAFFAGFLLLLYALFTRY